MDMSPLTTIGCRLESLALRPMLEPTCLPGVRVHFISLADCAAREAELLGLLSPDECERALAIRNARRRSAYIASRALLREALSNYTSQTVGRGEWRFDTNAYGKPQVVAPLALSFSLSYTSTLLVIAVSKRFELGVDIEAQPSEASAEIPWHVLNSVERKHLHTLPVGEQYLEFLRLWTLKEAYTKYIGMGASLDFRGVDISLDPIEASAPAAPAGRLGDPLLHQQVLSLDGQCFVLALAGGRILY
jgi:phosphopantetheinyl transferase